MIGVGFALTGTLVLDRGIDERSFEHVLIGIARECAVPIENTALRAAAVEFAAAVTREPASRDELLQRSAQQLLGVKASLHIVAGRLRSSVAGLIADATEVPADTRSTLAQIAQLNIPCAVLSNGWNTAEQRRAALLGVSGPVLVGEDNGHWKPHADAFDGLAAALRLPHEQIFYVGADPYLDIIPAAELGFRTVWLNREGGAFPDPTLTPEFTIANLSELLRYLAESYSRSALGLRYVLHNALGWRMGYFVPGVEYGLNDLESLRFTATRPELS